MQANTDTISPDGSGHLHHGAGDVLVDTSVSRRCDDACPSSTAVSPHSPKGTLRHKRRKAARTVPPNWLRRSRTKREVRLGIAERSLRPLTSGGQWEEVT